MADKKKPAKKKQSGPLAGRRVVVVAPSVVEANAAGALVKKKHKLKDTPGAYTAIPAGLGASKKVAVVFANGASVEDRERLRLNRALDVAWFTVDELLM